MLTPTPLTVAFDGTRFFKLSPPDKRLEVFEVKLPAEKAALFLTTQFSPFVPEGYRTPLLPMKGVTAQKVSHAKSPEAFELVHRTADEAGKPITVTWTLRFPGGDFLAKKTEANGVVSELVVEEELCDAALALCVPKLVVQREGASEVGRTTFTRIELAPGEAGQTRDQLNGIFALIEEMQAANTAGVEPMAHAQDVAQRLRLGRPADGEVALHRQRELRRGGRGADGRPPQGGEDGIRKGGVRRVAGRHRRVVAALEGVVEPPDDLGRLVHRPPKTLQGPADRAGP